MVRLFSQSSHGALLPEGYPKMWLQLEGGATLAALSYIYQQLRGSWCADMRHLEPIKGSYFS